MSSHSTSAKLTPLSAPVGIKPFYTQHASALDLKVHVTKKSVTVLDMNVVDEDTGMKVFEVYGKFASFSREVHLKAADGKTLYIMRQKKAALRYTFNAIDVEAQAGSGSKPKFDSKQAVFTATGTGGWKKSFDLAVTMRAKGEESVEKEEQTLRLCTGVMKDVSDIVDANGNIVAHINRSKSGVGKWSITESYLLRVAPGADASVVLLIAICLHVQLVDWKLAVMS